MSSEQIDDFVNSIFTSYRETGFPFYNLSLEEQQTQIKKMNSYCEKNDILINGVLKQKMHCLYVAWSYFPHSWGVKCNDMITPIEAFEDDDKFKKLLSERSWLFGKKSTLEMLLKYDLEEFDNKYFDKK